MSLSKVYCHSEACEASRGNLKEKCCCKRFPHRFAPRNDNKLYDIAPSGVFYAFCFRLNTVGWYITTYAPASKRVEITVTVSPIVNALLL